MSDLTPYTYITIEPSKPHSATVIWLHGLGDSGKGMYYPASTLLESVSGLEHVKFIFPTAHVMKITGSGVRMNSWFDCYSFNYETRDEDEKGLNHAALLVESIIEKEEKECGIPPERIVIGGISQGSATALHAALTSKRTLAGVFVLAGYVALRKKIKEIIALHASSLPIFWGHGRDDDRLKIDFSLKTADALAVDLGVSLNGYTGRLGLSHSESESESDVQSDERHHALTDHSFGDDPDSYSSKDQKARMIPTPIDAETLAVDASMKPGIQFVTYEDLGHWMNEPMLEDLGIWMRTMIPGT